VSFPSRQLKFLLSHDHVDHRLWIWQSADNVLIQHADIARSDCPHGELGLVGKPKFPHHNHVQGSIQGGGDFEGHGHAAARQAQDHNVLATQFRQTPAELPAGVDPVFKDAHGLWLSSRSVGHRPSVVCC